MHKMQQLGFSGSAKFFPAKCMFRNKPPKINPTKILCYTVFCNSCQVFLKISHVCRHLHKKYACTARTLITLIATSNSKLHHMSILGQWIHVCLLCIRKKFKANADTKHLVPYSNNLRGCHHQSNRGVW